MPDNVYEQNVYSYLEPMWHSKGYVGTLQETCVQVYNRMKTILFKKRPYTITLNGEEVESKEFAIVRIQDGKERIIGRTRGIYKVVQPLAYCEIYDQAVGKPCETLGFLGSDAEKMFITSLLPSITVYGDEIKLYQLLSIGFDGFYGVHQFVSAIRTVCQNTHNMAVAEATTTDNHGRGKLYNGRHNMPNHERDLFEWLKYVDQESEAMVNVTKALFTKMEDTPITVDEAFGLTKAIYPDPKNLPEFFPDNLRNEKQEKINEEVEKAEESRDLVMDLFKGAGIAITPTAYGLYNSVTEAENHHRKSKKETTYSILLGNRHNIMENAMAVIGDWVTNGQGGN
jgi:hypothetical protein